ncbi:MAG TPA: DMT family transporter [Candidatus Eisenbacteria bacterium]|nr:DMT family transporter [Candidatus Eisenbacteria bacterium]
MTKILFGLAAVTAGAAAAFQAAANAGLASRIGLGAALVVNTSIVLVGTLILYVAAGRSGTFFPSDAPWSLYIGGLCGFVLLLSLAFVFPKIGAAVAIALVVLGQGAAALAIDHFGLLGMPTEPITLARVAGMLLVGAGLVLVRG